MCTTSLWPPNLSRWWPAPTHMNVNHIIPYMHPAAGGPPVVVDQLSRQLARRGHQVRVLTTDLHANGDCSWTRGDQRPYRLDVYSAVAGNPFGFSVRLWKAVRESLRDCDVVHIHTLWTFATIAATRSCLGAGIPFLIMPHGMLEPWAISRSRWRKRAVGMLLHDRGLRAADCIQALNERELDGIRSYGLKCPVAVIPNGIHIPDFEQLPSERVFHDAFPETRDKRLVLFMGRLHVKKGLEHLLLAWSRVHNQYPEWHLVIAGPDCGFGKRARELVGALKLKNAVTFTDNLQGGLRLAALSAAGCFVLPSFSEGFSVAVLEAFACRLPALITPGCNFREAAAAGAALEVSPDREGTEEGLRNLLSATDRERETMGQRGRCLSKRPIHGIALPGKPSNCIPGFSDAASAPPR